VIRNTIEENAKEYNLSNKQINRTIYDLKRYKYVECLGDSVIFTNKAKIKIIDKIAADQVIDGKSRLVSFDIPEPLKRNRDHFRRTLKRLGFLKLQKSLWICNKNVGALVEIAATEYGVNNYVAYFVADKSNIDKHIKQLFDKK